MKDNEIISLFELRDEHAIAERHAMSVGSVKMNLYRSRKKLLKVLKKEGKHL